MKHLSPAGIETLKIRHRYRRGYVKELGCYSNWQEYQVVNGRKILSRHDTQDQAERARAALASQKGNANG